MTDTTKKCPMCAEEIKLEARLCRFCGARFMVRESGYCQNCHRLVNADLTGKCASCGSEVTDRHIVSALIREAAPPTEQMPVTPNVPPTRSNKKSAPGILDFRQLYFLPQGRIGRKTFVLEGLLPVALMSALLTNIIISSGDAEVKITNFGTALTVLSALVLLWIFLMLLVKRLHDLHRSGWITLYWLAIFAGTALSDFLFPTQGTGRAVIYVLASFLGLMIFLGQLMRAMFVKGDADANKYGLEPEWLPTTRVVSSAATTLSVKDSLSQRRRWIAGLLAMFLVPLALFSLIRYFIDQNNLQQGLAAFEQADCIAANGSFDKVTHSWRLLDFGDIKAQALAKQESCRPFLEAAGKQEAGEYNSALSAFTDLALNPSTAPSLARAARERIGSLFESRQPSELSNVETCQKLADIQAAGMIPQPEVHLPELFFACANAYQTGGMESEALNLYKRVLIDYPNHALTSAAEEAILASSESCENVDSLQAESAIAARENLMPSLLYNCGQSYENKEQYQNAVDMYENFLEHYPNHARASDVNTALARALVNAAKAAGAGEIAPPSKSGDTSSGSTTVVIQNDSPEKLRIVFSGPEARIVELPACSGCTTYMISPFSCPELGPIGRYTLQPGTYDVLVESISDSGVTPYTGNWSLVSGDEYSSCFFIIQRYKFTP